MPSSQRRPSVLDSVKNARPNWTFFWRAFFAAISWLFPPERNYRHFSPGFEFSI